MKLFPIVFLLAVVCLAVAAGETRDDICNSQRTPRKLIARRTWPGETATTTTTTAKPTTVTTSSPTTTTAKTSTARTSSPVSTTTVGPSTTAPTTATTTTTMATTTPLRPLFNCSVSDPECGSMCGDVTSTTTGVVQSPNFPADYGRDYKYCTATITAPAGWMIQLKFTTFNVETDIGFVSGFDGLNYLPRISGNTIPAFVPTSTESLSISFEVYPSTKPSTAIYNWQATLSVTSQGSACFVYNPACDNMCTNVTSAGSGVVQSPNFPGDYRSGSRSCGVTLIVPAGKRIQLTFTTFNVETGYSYITVNDKETTYLFMASGSTIPAVVTTESNKLLLQFYSSASTQLSNTATYNWQATYTAVTV